MPEEIRSTFPVFQINKSAPLKSTEVLGLLTTLGFHDQIWIEDGAIGFLLHGAQLTRGRWSARSEQWSFKPDDPNDLTALRTEQQWQVLDGYWGAQAALVLNATLEWRRRRFMPSDAIRIENAGGHVLGSTLEGHLREQLVPGGWDHEHCELCWATIGHGGQPDGFVSSDGSWVCSSSSLD